GKSNYQARRSLILREIIDVLELAMANPVNYFKIDKIFEENPEKLQDFQIVVEAISERFLYQSKYFGRPKKIKEDIKIRPALQQIKDDILQLIEVAEKDGQNNNEKILSLKNYWRYL